MSSFGQVYEAEFADLFSDDDGDGAGTGPVLWADVASSGGNWAPSPAARCVYERFWARGSQCPEAPDTSSVQ
ncbi:MAG: hypothetical protein ACK5O2_04040 [Microthrixaceae bacterium]